MSELVEYNQPTSAIVPKVAAVGKANAIATGVAAVVTLLSFTGIIVPDNINNDAVAAITGAITVFSLLQGIFSFVAGFMKKDKKPAEAVAIITNQTESTDLRG